MSIESLDTLLEPQQCLVVTAASVEFRRSERGMRRTSATVRVSFHNKLLSFLTNPPLGFLLLILTITSPAARSGLSSASPSNLVSVPSGIPRSI